MFDRTAQRGNCLRIHVHRRRVPTLRASVGLDRASGPLRRRSVRIGGELLRESMACQQATKLSRMPAIRRKTQRPSAHSSSWVTQCIPQPLRDKTDGVGYSCHGFLRISFANQRLVGWLLRWQPNKNTDKPGTILPDSNTSRRFFDGLSKFIAFSAFYICGEAIFHS